MSQSGFLIDYDTAQRISAAVLAHERGQGSPPPSGQINTPSAPSPLVVKVTGPIAGGQYPAQVQGLGTMGGQVGQWINLAPCLAVELNGGTLARDSRYLGRIIATSSLGFPVVAVTSGGGGGGPLFDAQVVTLLNCVNGYLSATYRTLRIPGGSWAP